MAEEGRTFARAVGSLQGYLELVLLREIFVELARMLVDGEIGRSMEKEGDLADGRRLGGLDA